MDVDMTQTKSLWSSGDVLNAQNQSSARTPMGQEKNLPWSAGRPGTGKSKATWFLSQAVRAWKHPTVEAQGKAKVEPSKHFFGRGTVLALAQFMQHNQAQTLLVRS